MPTVTLAEAQARLPELIQELIPGLDVAITENDRVVARLVGEPPKKMQPRQPGNCKGMLFIHAEDDEHLKDFEEYMVP